MEWETNEARKHCLAARRGLSQEARAAYSGQICRRLISLPVLHSAQVIFSYQACWDEADLTAFHQWARAEGKTLAFPYTGPAGAMEALAPQSDSAWTLDRYGIRMPLPEASRQIAPGSIDAVLMPCVGFDGAGNRLGHGAGYYDRYAVRCPKAARIVVGFEAQRCPALYPASWDAPADILVTESVCQFFDFS